MEVKTFKDSAGVKVGIGNTVALLRLNGEMFDKGKVERIEKRGYIITVFIVERPRYRFYPESLRKYE